jgi:Family of unknown function (DUF5683)
MGRRAAGEADHVIRRGVRIVRLETLAGLWLLSGFLAPRIGAQVAPPPPAAEALVSDTLAPLGTREVSPGGAFLRAVLVPGWGHASIGAYTRAGFYFTLESATAYGLLRTRERIRDVDRLVEFRETLLRADLAAQGITDFQEIEDALADDADLEDLRALADSRRNQREDWVALGIFLLFLSGADAYVSAHLQDFPAPIEVNAVPVGQGRMEIGVRLKLPN